MTSEQVEQVGPPEVDVPQVDVPQVDPPQVDVPQVEASATGGPAAELSDSALRGALEAVLLVVDEPVPSARLAAGLGIPEPRVLDVLERLRAELRERGSGIALREIAGGWRFYTADEYADDVGRFLLDGQSARLSQAALETLAVIAYQQPISRARVAAVRGVNVDGVVRTLVVRGLIAEQGTEDGSGALLYGTTPLFLERLGINDVAELPPLAPLLPDLGGLADTDVDQRRAPRGAAADSATEADIDLRESGSASASAPPATTDR